MPVRRQRGLGKQCNQSRLLIPHAMRWTPMATQKAAPQRSPVLFRASLGWEKDFALTVSGVACHDSIDYRRSTMKIDRASAQTYARWFQALADANRVVICNLLADAGRPMTVGEIVEAVPTAAELVMGQLPRAQGVQCLPGGQAIQQRKQEIAG